MRGNRLVPSIALALLAALGSGLVGPYVAHAADKHRPKPRAAARITFGLQPATKGAPDARPNYRYSVTPGGTLRDQVAVRNLSTSAVTMRVYATDAVNVDNGGFGLLPRAQRPRDVGRWVSVGGRTHDGTVTVRPRSVKVLPLTLKVPRNAQPGDHTGGIVVAVTTRSRNAKGTNVELDQRVGARMFVRVSGPLRPALTVRPLEAQYGNMLNPFGRGNTDVTYRVTNTGNVNLGGRTRLSVRGLIGPEQLSVRVPDAGLLLPGGFIDVKTSVHQTWPLVRERATVTIDPLVQRGDPATGLTAYSGSASFWAVPWTFLALLAVIGLGLWLRRRIRRRRIARPAGTRAASQTAASQTGASQTGASRTGGNESGVGGVGVSQRSAGRWVMSSTLALAAVIAASGTAVAADVPYTDANVTGGITLCDAQGHVRTSGRVDVPLAATVVGGSPAASPYDGNGRTAGLFAYQPRRGVEPGDWSGQGLTALSRYSNPKHPMVEILPRDYKVSDFIRAYPAQWDGLVQLRIYLRAPNQPIKEDKYSAVTLKVTGSTWQQAGKPAGGGCSAGHAVSVVRLLGLPTTLQTTAPSAPPSPPLSAPPTGRSGSPSPGSAGPSPSKRPAAAATTSTRSAVSSSRDRSGSLASGTAANAGPAGASTDHGRRLPPAVLPISLLTTAVALLWLWSRRKQGRRDGS